MAQRGIVDPILCRYRIGWDGTRIVIPITDKERRVTFFRFVKEPQDETSGPAVVSWPDARPEVFGWERLTARREGLVLCIGELNRLLLETYGIASITTTDGLATFREEWIRPLGQIEALFVCISVSECTVELLDRLTTAIPHARLIAPELLGAAGIAEFFLQRGGTRQDFDRLCSLAQPLLGLVVGSNDSDQHA